MASSTVRHPAGTRQPTRRGTVLAALADTVLILAFAAVGRDAHQRGDIITGVFATAWPFLAGAALAWVTLRLWRGPSRLWPAGVAVWLGAVAIGMLLRAATGQTVVLPFVIVALLSLGLVLLGWRLAAAGAARFRARRRRA